MIEKNNIYTKHNMKFFRKIIEGIDFLLSCGNPVGTVPVYPFGGEPEKTEGESSSLSLLDLQDKSLTSSMPEDFQLDSNQDNQLPNDEQEYWAHFGEYR